MLKKLLLALAATVATTSALAYPDKPVTVIVPYAAGGPTDKAARDLTAAMQKAMPGSSFLIENVLGAGGSIGATKAARSTNDGYTLLFIHIGMATLPAMYRKLNYNALNDFEYLGIVSENPMTIVSRPNIPANNYPEFKSWLESNRGKINLAHAGQGSASHLCGLLFQQGLQIDMTTIPYKGTAPAMTDLISGQVDVMCDQTTTTVQQIEGNKIKVFAVSTNKPVNNPVLAKVPTLDSVGMKGFNVAIWQGLYAPKGTPAAVLEKLQAAMKTATKDPVFVKAQESLGASVVLDERSSPAGHKKFVEAEIVKWTAAIKAAGQYAD